MAEKYEIGELFVYVNGDRWELGMVKRPNNTGDGYFCWYSRGDTAANTPVSCMYKLSNAGWTHIEQVCDGLRELLMTAYKAATEPDCSDCYNEHSCKNNELSYCVMWVELEQKMRDKLAIEVDG